MFDSESEKQEGEMGSGLGSGFYRGRRGSREHVADKDWLFSK